MDTFDGQLVAGVVEWLLGEVFGVLARILDRGEYRFVPYFRYLSS